MANIGGSANINGILYQILGALDKALSIRMEGALSNGDDILEARLVIEPADGGDLQYESHSGRIVQQWKAKAKGGTWSLQTIVQEVLPDLYLSVPNDNLDLHIRYEFITEGRKGKWDEAYEFFQTLPSPPAPESLLGALSDIPKRHKCGKVSLSDRGLFERILAECRKRKSVENESESLSRQKLWHLLQRFVMTNSVSQEQLVARINEFLSHHVEIAEEVDGKRRELCGALLEIAGAGDQTLTPTSLLKKAHIPLSSMKNWPRLQRRLRARLKEQLRKEQYDPGLNVRASPAQQGDVTLFSGESGQGKTWWLACTASELSESDALVLWVPSSRGTAKVAEYVAHEIWNYGLERDSQLTLERIAARREHSNPTVEKPWAFVCVDDVRSLDEALSLRNLDWNRWGMALLMSTSPEIAQGIAFNCQCTVLPVLDFDQSQLRAYLKKRRVAWSRIALDVRELILRPILAKLYADIAEGETGFKPRTEYDLLEAAWNRVSNPTEIGLIRMLAGKIHQPNPTYPWPVEYVLELGGSVDTINRLIEQGWLQDLGDGNVALWHHRFLYWAYAKHLVALINSGKLSVRELGGVLRDCRWQASPDRFQLGYVPMDVLWQLLGPSSAAGERPELWRLVEALEKYAGMSHEDESLYSHLLASLGERVVPLLVDRVRHSGEDPHNAIPRRAAEALLIIGRHHPDIISREARRCLDAGQAAMIELGLRLAVGFPRSVDPDRVWEIYRSKILQEKNNVSYHLQQELADRAFRAVAEQYPDWFKEMLIRGDSDDSCFAALACALGSLGGNCHARKVWLATKKHLFQAIPLHKRRCLVQCIANFCDTNEYSRLREWATAGEEHIGSTSALALAYRVPEHALAAITKMPAEELWGTASQIGTALLVVIPDETCTEVERLIRERPDYADIYVSILSGNGDRLPRPTVSVLLDWLESTLQVYFGDPSEKQLPSVHRALFFTEGLYGVNVLTELHRRQGSSLEKLLVSFAQSRIPKSSQGIGREIAQARVILARIAGVGVTLLSNALISSGNRWLRLAGCAAAAIRPDQETRQLLRREALSDDMGESGPNIIQRCAIETLAALGDDAGLVEGIMKWGPSVSLDIGDLREGQSAISDEDLEPALACLSDPESEQFTNAILAVGQSGRSEYLEQIEHLLLKSDCGSRVAEACLLALDDLASNCDRILDRLVEQYLSGQFKLPVVRIFVNCDVPTHEFLRLLPEEGRHDDMDRRVVRFLASDEASRSAVDHHIRRIIESGDSFLEDTVGLLDPKQETDREILWRKSLQPGLGVHFVGAKAAAIKALGSVSSDAAFEIGLESLRSDQRDRDTIPYVLMQLAPEKAIGELCSVIRETDDYVLCAAVGRAFRQYALPAHVIKPIVSLLSDSNWKSRRAGAFVAGFLGQGMVGDELLRVAYNDPKWAVCAEAQKALRSRQREAEAARLVAMLDSAEQPDVWGLVDFIVQLADPDILVLESDPIGFLASLEEQLFGVRKYAIDAINKRRVQLKKDMTPLQGKWEDD